MENFCWNCEMEIFSSSNLLAREMRAVFTMFLYLQYLSMGIFHPSNGSSSSSFISTQPFVNDT